MSLTCNFTWTQYDIATCIRGDKPSGNKIWGLTNQEDPLIPQEQADFIPPKFLADIIVGLRMREPLFIFGPTGCAKTAAVRWACARFHKPLVSVTGHARLEFADLIGHYTVTNGTLTWVDGPLLTAIRYGCTFCFDELTLCPPETLVGLHGILDRHPLVVPETNELVPVHEHFQFVATDNTNGAGDESGQYLGTLRQNQALMNRCFFIEASYLEPAQELAHLKQYANGRLPEGVISLMLNFATDVRECKTNYPVNTTVSVRDLHRWIDAAHLYAFIAKKGLDPLKYTLERAILMRCTPTDRETLLKLYEALREPESARKHTVYTEKE